MLRIGLRDPVWTRSCVKRKTNSCSTPGAGPAAGRVPRPGLQNVGGSSFNEKTWGGGGVLNDGRKEVGGRRRGKTETAARPSGRGRPFGTNSWEKVTLDNNRFVGRRLPPALRWGPREKSRGLWLEAPPDFHHQPPRAWTPAWPHVTTDSATGKGGHYRRVPSLYAGSRSSRPRAPFHPTRVPRACFSPILGQDNPRFCLSHTV